MPGTRFGVVVSDLLFCFFLLSHGIQLTHHWCILCTIDTCVFALMGLLATYTAAGDGSPCLAVCVVCGQVLATLVVHRALFCHTLLICLDDVVFFLTQVLWSICCCLACGGTVFSPVCRVAVWLVVLV